MNAPMFVEFGDTILNISQVISITKEIDGTKVKKVEGDKYQITGKPFLIVIESSGEKKIRLEYDDAVARDRYYNQLFEGVQAVRR